MEPTADTDPTGLAQKKPDSKSPKSPRATLGRAIGFGSILIMLIAAVVAYRWCTLHPRSDDAIVTADSIGVASRVAGPIKILPIRENQLVHKGDILFVVDEAPYRLAVQVARANLAVANGELQNAMLAIAAQKDQAEAAAQALNQAQAALATASDNYNRLAPLLANHYASAQEVDSALHSVQSAKAGVAAASAQMMAAQSAVQTIAAVQARRDAAAAAVAQAELALKYCTAKAPFDGLVTGLTLSAGAYANVGISLFRLIDSDQWWVEAPFRESELRRIRVGDHAEVELKTISGKTFGGTVESIVWGVTPEPTDPVPGLPIVPRDLDWVKLAQRFPVRVRLDKGIPQELLRVGVTATVTINSSH